ncbi:hypothetical protein ACWD4V_18020 [Streptomyces tsukubensis]|uniref:hypothetical protein n=1 Tax=Streptomyces tsukubensis TaxID=83656 RepID=UPI0036902FC2
MTETPSTADARLTELLAQAHAALGDAVLRSLTAQGGVPELRDPDLALDRLVAQSGRALADEITRRLGPAPTPPPASVPDAPDPLRARPAPLRLRYRAQALDLLHPYQVDALLDRLQAAVVCLGRLAVTVFHDQTPDGPEVARLGRVLESAFRSVDELPRRPPRKPSAPAADGYLETITLLLVEHSDRIRYETEAAREYAAENIDELLAQAVDPHPEADLSVLAVAAVDLQDDLEGIRQTAVRLSRTVGRVQDAACDFRGEDLRVVELDDVPLAGVRWNTATTWPQEWEDRIRRVSSPSAPGTYVIKAEPEPSSVAADA